MAFKAMFSDVDGTLITNTFDITDATKEAIMKQVDKGIPFTTVTARGGPAMAPIRRHFNFPAYQIIFSGALVEDPNGEMILSRTLTPDQVHKIYDVIENHCPGVLPTCYTRETWFAPYDDGKWIPFEANCTEISPVFGEKPTDDMPVYKFLCMGEEDVTDKALQILKEKLPELTIYKSSRFYIEVLSGEASKSRAIAFLLEKWGMTKDEIIAFGDSYNDIDMLEYAGFGVAMGNAPDPVKASANAVTDDNDHDGLAKAINTYME